MAKKYRDVRRALRDNGFQHLRAQGSHELWEHPDGRRVVPSLTLSLGVVAGDLDRVSAEVYRETFGARDRIDDQFATPDAGVCAARSAILSRRSPR